MVWCLDFEEEGDTEKTVPSKKLIGYGFLSSLFKLNRWDWKWAWIYGLKARSYEDKIYMIRQFNFLYFIALWKGWYQNKYFDTGKAILVSTSPRLSTRGAGSHLRLIVKLCYSIYMNIKSRVEKRKLDLREEPVKMNAQHHCIKDKEQEIG